MRYAYAITSAVLLGGAAAAMTLQPPALAQTAQNEPSAMAALAPRAGAPISFADLVARLQPAVVNISTKQSIKVPQQSANPFAGTPFAELFGGQGQGQGAPTPPPVTREAQSLGSGFLISDDGYVVTNNHVVAPARGASVDSITVTLTNRKEYVAKLIGRDPASDLALLKIEAKGLPFVKFGDSERARVGDWVIAIGNPFGIGSTVTAGIVSALHRATGQGGAYDRFIQTDAAINQGNSGGPMFDLNGNVIGINSQIFAGQSGGNIGIGFAIPAVEAKPIIEKLMQGTAIARGYLGVGMRPLTEDVAEALGLPKNSGEIIQSVSPGAPAEKAGVMVGDVIVAVNGQAVTQDASLSYLVSNVKPGTRIPVDIIRGGKKQTLTVVVGTRPSEDALAAAAGGVPDDDAMAQPDTDGPASPVANKLGLAVLPLTPQIAQNIGVDPAVKGVVISGTDPTSDAGQKLQRGDVIISVNGTAVATSAALSAVVAQAIKDGRPSVLLYVQRQRIPARFVPVKLKK